MSPAYRPEDTEFLKNHVKHNHSVELVGMRRVGINNFLRHFFVQHKFGITDKQMYIFIDLNNLVEREAFPFWQLTLKRISDAVRDLVTDKELRKEITMIFESAIQYQNLQMSYDGVREALGELVKNDIEPVIVFNRFDRIVNMMSDSFIDNIRGLYDAAGHRLSCIFTSYRPLSDFYNKKIPFDQFYTHFLTPLSEKEMDQHIAEYEKKYRLTFDKDTREIMSDLSGGHFQYLRFLMDIVRESKTNSSDLSTSALKDERVLLLSEEIWDSLRDEEKNILSQVADGKKITDKNIEKVPYIIKTQIVNDDKIFSYLFQSYVVSKESDVKQSFPVEFTKKEHVLFTLLKSKMDSICEREEIIEKVWPESAEDGISDWSIDKLMERLREKIKKQGLPYQVMTIRTRGYKLVTSPA